MSASNHGMHTDALTRAGDARRWVDKMNNKMRRIIFICLICSLSFVSYAHTIDKSKPIDLDIVRKIDVTGDGEVDTINLHLKAKDFQSPFLWKLTISSSGKQIFKSESNDTWMNSFFSDRGYVLGCTNYDTCKEKYYFHDIIDSLIHDKSSYDLEGILNRTASNTLYPVGRSHLKKCCSIQGPQADKILAGIESRLRSGKAIVISVLKSPVKSGAPMVYAPEIHGFVPIYED